MSDTVLSMCLVGRTYGKGAQRVEALIDVDLDVAAGEMIAIMGRSGSGKSTLLNLAGGLDEPTAGSVTVEGTDLGDLNRRGLAEMRRRAVGFVFQDFNLIPSLRAIENVSLPLELDGVGVGAARELAETSLAEVGLAGTGHRFPDELSGGEQQRVAIARGLVGPRRLLLADEPTGALDEVTGEGVLRLMRQRCDDGAAALLVTHDPGWAAWADRVVLLRDGRIESVSRKSVTPPSLTSLLS